MIDDKNKADVQDREADAGREETVLPIVPLPLGGFSAAGQLGATAGNINATSGAFAPLVGGAAAFEPADTDRYEDADMQIADRVEEVLAEDGRLSGAQIAVAVAEGTVELTGSVPSERVRETAGEVCAHVPGVRAVENRLTVS